MSLVGSLEDLGLGDILQIISLSRKSGVLFLRGDQGEGRIVFEAGLVQAAFAKGGPTDLRGLVVQGGVLPERDFEAVSQAARGRGEALVDALSAHPAVGPERLEGLRRAATEAAVVEMFRWRAGDFSFEIRDEGEAEREAGMLLTAGLSPQYLAMEATRLRDEAEGGRDDAGDDGGLVLSGDEPEPPVDARAEAVEVVASAAAADDVDLAAADAGVEAAEVAAEDETGDLAVAVVEDEPPDVVAPEAAGPTPAIVAIDRDLATLEWIKTSLRATFPRVHIFQRTELGIERIRQYLARGEAPVVIVSNHVPSDPWSGARDVAEVVERLKAQAPRTPVLVLVEPGAADAAPARADGSIEGPGTALGTKRGRADVERAARHLEHAIRAWAGRAGLRRPTRDPLVGASPEVGRLKATSARLRDPASRGEVLPLVMRFAAESFARVAIFMLREDVAAGIAQLGLAKAGGPDDDALRGVTWPLRETPCLRRVYETRAPLRTALGEAGDAAFARALGSRAPREAYLAPIESGERVVAILYADQLPEETPMGDTSALEIVLHEAGLALDRAVLERALAES